MCSRVASSPGPFPAFQCCTLKSGRAWYQKSRDRFIRTPAYEGVKMNMGEPKISKVQGAAVHDLLEVRLRNYRAIVVQSF